MVDFIQKHKRSISIACFYEVMGIVLGNWYARTPEIKADQGLNDLIFGAILVCSVGGALFSTAVVGAIVEKFGSRIGALSGGLVTILTVPLIAIPSEGIWLFSLGITCLGFGFGILDVSSNSQASLLEKSTNNNWFGYFQGHFSIGSMIGALLGGTLATSSISPFYGFIFIGALVLPFILVAQYGLFNKEEETAYNQDFKILNDSLGRESVSHRTDNGLVELQNMNENSKDNEIGNENKSESNQYNDITVSTEIINSSSVEISSGTNAPATTCCSKQWTQFYALCGIALIAAMAEGIYKINYFYFFTSSSPLNFAIALN